MKSLKLRFIFSHILPVMITIPLIAIAFNYAMETHFILKDMEETIQEQAALITQYSKGNPKVWESEGEAERMIREIRPQLVTGVILFNQEWNALATNQSGGLMDVANRYPPPMLEMEFGATGFEPILNISRFNPFSPSDEIISMMVPVANDQNQMLGVIRLNFPSTYFNDQLEQTSSRVKMIMLCGILIGGIFGLINATSLEKNLSKTTNAIYDLSIGVRSDPLPEDGPVELQKLNTAFNTLSQKLDTSEQTRVKLVSYLTHEIGRPLGGLSSAVDALQMGADQDERLARDLTSGMKNEIKRLELLVGDISLLREKTDPINLYVMNNTAVTPWVEDIYDYWIEFSKGKEVDLKAEIEPDLPTLNIDENRLFHAVGNLLSNAIKYSPKGKTVYLRACQVGQEIQISVHDEGIGISAEDQLHIFESFYRGSENKRFTQGMGLGLTISQDVVQAHQGTISVQSELGKGSTFTIHLPIEQAG